MVKTQKKRSFAKKTCKNNATFYAFNVWYKDMFEKLGWMVLAKSWGGMEDKLISYKKSIHRLEHKLACKMNEVHDPDKKDDLYIMWKNVQVLKAHADKDL
jgi:ribulose kinase